MLSVIAIILFGVTMILLGRTFKGDPNDPDDFNMSQRNVGPLRVTCGVFSVVGAGELAIMSSLSSSYGYWSVLLFIGFVVGCLALSMAITEIRRHESTKASHILYSIPDFLFQKYGYAGSIVSTVVLSLALGSLILMQLAFGGKVLHELNANLTPMFYAFSIVVVVAIYVIWDGIKAVLATDVVQVFAMFILFGIFAVLAVSDFPAQPSHEMSFTEMPFGLVASLLVGGFFWTLGGGDIWQRVIAAKTDGVARWSMYTNIVLLAVFGGIIAHLSIKWLPFHEGDPTYLFVTIGRSMPPEYAAWLSLALFASLISTADTELLVVSQMLSREFWLRRRVPLDVPSVRVFCVIVAVLSLIATYYFIDAIIPIYYFMLNTFSIVGMLAMMGLFKRGNRYSIVATSAISLTYLVVRGFNITPWESASVPVIIMSLNLPFSCEDKGPHDKTRDDH